jgi:hypothetical protein
MARACTVKWKHSRFGWDALKYEGGRVVNAINTGYKRKPTAAQKSEATRLLCGRKRQ